MSQEVSRDPQLLKGVLPMLALALLEKQESYGYELVARLRDAGMEGIAPGTVYPVLSRLEREGRLTARLVPSPSGPARKYYRPTDAGRRYMMQTRTAWEALNGVVENIVVKEESG